MCTNSKSQASFPLVRIFRLLTDPLPLPAYVLYGCPHHHRSCKGRDRNTICYFSHNLISFQCVSNFNIVYFLAIKFDISPCTDSIQMYLNHVKIAINLLRKLALFWLKATFCFPTTQKHQILTYTYHKFIIRISKTTYPTAFLDPSF